MLKNTKIFFIAFVLFFVSFSPFIPAAQAQPTGLQYQLLEKIPGTDTLGNDLPGYVNAIYKIALIVVTLSAVLMLSIGGFMYLTSAGNTSAMGTAKGIIYDSIIGLVIALSAWLILYIINPDLVEISLTALPPVTMTSAPAASPGSVGTLPPASSVELAANILASGNITLPSSGDCRSSSGFVSPRSNIRSIADGERADYCTNGCTSAAIGCITEGTTLSNTMLRAIWRVGGPAPEGLNMSFTITSISGGSHANGSTHYAGRGIDIVPVTQALMDAFVAAGAAAPNGNAASMCENTRGVNVGCASGSGADHIHLVFPN